MTNEEKTLLLSIANSLELVKVEGKQNWSIMLGCVNAINSLLNGDEKNDGNANG